MKDGHSARNATQIENKLRIDFKSKQHANSFVNVPLPSIDFDDKTFCFRASLNLKSLITDLEKNGQDFPVVLRKKKNRKKYQLVCGFRRVGALIALNAKTAKAIILPLSDDEALRLSWSENESRRSYSPIDRAIAIHKAHSSGKTIEELQEIFCLKKRQLLRLKKVALLPKNICDAVTNQRITTTHAIVLNQAAEKNEAVDVEYWLKAISKNSLSIRQLKYRLNRQCRNKKKVSLIEIDGIIRLRSTKIKVDDLTVSDKKQIRDVANRLLEIAGV